MENPSSMSTINNAIHAVQAAKSSAIQMQIGIAVLAKSQAAAKQQGQAAVELLEATAQLSKALGKGQHFDSVA